MNNDIFSREALQNPVILAGLVVVALAVASVAGSAGKFAGALLFDPKPKPIVQTTAPTVRLDPTAIVDRNFFGIASDKPSVALEALPETDLKLVLRAAFAASEESEAGAIIENENKVAEQYSVGDALPGNASLTAIYPDRVVLSRNGLLETLYFPNDVSSAGIGSRRNVNAQATGPNTLQSPAAGGQATDERRQAIRERIRQLRGK